MKQITPLKNDAAVKAVDVGKVEDAIQRYLEDAKHYLEENQPVTSLASIAYAEGLLDALAFLGLVRDETTAQPSRTNLNAR